MDIAFAFDHHYADHAQVAMESVLDSHPHRDDLTFWMLTTPEVTAERSASLRQQVAGRAAVELLALGEGVAALPTSQVDRCSYISVATYLRLFLPGLMASRVDRLLYLDSDVMVNGDLGPLWNLPLGDAPLAAVRDGLARSMGYEGGIPGAGPHVRDGAAYFNAGVMLINVPVWQRMSVTERCLAYLAEHRDHVRFADQDALNLVCYGRWLRLSAIWNDMVRWWLRPDDCEAVCRSVRITHFLGPVKPWHREFRFAEYAERYRSLMARVPGLRQPEPTPAPLPELTQPLLRNGSIVDPGRPHTLRPSAPWIRPVATA